MSTTAAAVARGSFDQTVALLRRLGVEILGGPQLAPGVLSLGNTEDIIRALRILVQIRNGMNTSGNATVGGATPDPMVPEAQGKMLKLPSLFGATKLLLALPRL